MKTVIETKQFRKELIKIMPGYKWTVHRPTVYGLDLDKKPTCLTATGIQVAGLNRMSTVEVTAQEKNGRVVYNSKSSGFGRNAPWLSSHEGTTLAQSFRRLQEHYEIKGNNYLRHAADLEGARAKNQDSDRK
uniref:Uncharacterized protein n=1 Tax=viral metagenome TaxID=1070528 RepID=A0A6M3KXF0_9ZZZZ